MDIGKMDFGENILRQDQLKTNICGDLDEKQSCP